MTFAHAYLARWWHGYTVGHGGYTMRYLELDEYTGRHRYRIGELGCRECGLIFWRVPS